MKKIFTYGLNILYYFCFGGILCLFHPLQWFALTIFGHKAHKATVDLLNFFLLRCLTILGTRFALSFAEPLPENASLIVVANHQSTYDIPPLIWYLRKHHLKFVSKKELGRGIPSVSFNLRHGGSVLIDRKDRAQALSQIRVFAHNIAKKKWGVVIFPEGTRSKNGLPKPFQKGGLSLLIKHIPNAYIVPVSIKNSWKLAQNNYFPMPLGTKILFKIHSPLAVANKNPDTLINQVEQIIKTDVETEAIASMSP
ncbi:MAG: lysophospholipid acyltransferase family protein [Flavobacteriaceae bacterium]